MLQAGQFDPISLFCFPYLFYTLSTTPSALPLCPSSQVGLCLRKGIKVASSVPQANLQAPLPPHLPASSLSLDAEREIWICPRDRSSA